MAMATMADRAPQDRMPIPAFVRACPRCGTWHPLESETPVRDPKALARLRPKLAELGERIDDMPEDEYGGWLNALPFAEFLEFIVLEEPCIAALMDKRTERMTAPSAPGDST